MKENTEYSLSLDYGPREAQAFKEINHLRKTIGDAEGKNEIFKEGLHCFRQLLEIDESLLANVLMDYLQRISKDIDFRILKIIISLSFALYATMIAKKGISQSDVFEIVPITMKSIKDL